MCTLLLFLPLNAMVQKSGSTSKKNQKSKRQTTCTKCLLKGLKWKTHGMTDSSFTQKMKIKIVSKSLRWDVRLDEEVDSFESRVTKSIWKIWDFLLSWHNQSKDYVTTFIGREITLLLRELAQMFSISTKFTIKWYSTITTPRTVFGWINSLVKSSSYTLILVLSPSKSFFFFFYLFKQLEWVLLKQLYVTYIVPQHLDWSRVHPLQLQVVCAALSASPAPTAPAWTHDGTLQPTGTSGEGRRHFALACTDWEISFFKVLFQGFLHLRSARTGQWAQQETEWGA